MSLLIGYLVFGAWQEPLHAPPTCLPGEPGCEAPINVSTTTQTKLGGLNIATQMGNVGIGTTSPGAKLDISNTTMGAGLKVITNYSAVFNYGVRGDASGGTSLNYGGMFTASGGVASLGSYGGASGASGNFGLYGVASGDTGTKYALYGLASGAGTNWGLYIASGDAYISGALTIKGTGGNVCHTVGGNWYNCPAGAGEAYWKLSGSNLYASSTAWNVGIGTTGPWGPLHVRSTSDNILNLQTADDSWLYSQWLQNDGTRRTWMGLNDNLTEFHINVENGTNEIILDGGNVGIGTTEPGAKLDVKGSGMFSSSIGNADIQLNSANRPTIYPNGGYTPANLNLQIRSKGTGALQLNADNSGNVEIATGGGNVGIGTTTPGYKLDISGGDLAIRNGNLRLRGALYDTFGGGDTYYLDLDVGGYLGGEVSATTLKGRSQLCIGTDCRSSWPSGGLGGSGTDNYIPRWNGTSTLENSVIYQTDDGNVGIGTSGPSQKLEVENGNITIDAWDSQYRGGYSAGGYSDRRMIGGAHGWNSNMLYINGWNDWTSGVSIGGPGGTSNLTVTGNLNVGGKVTDSYGDIVSCKNVDYTTMVSGQTTWYDIDISLCYWFGCEFRLGYLTTGFNPSYAWSDYNRVQGYLGTSWGYPSGGEGQYFIWAEGTRNDGTHQNYEAINGAAAGSDVAIASTYGDNCVLWNHRTDSNKMRLRMVSPSWTAVFTHCSLTICPVRR